MVALKTPTSNVEFALQTFDIVDAPIPLSVIAKQFGVAALAVWKWKKLGRRNPYTGERVYAEFTWLPGGKWGMTRHQVTAFIAALNEKP